MHSKLHTKAVMTDHHFVSFLPPKLNVTIQCHTIVKGWDNHQAPKSQKSLKCMHKEKLISRQNISVKYDN